MFERHDQVKAPLYVVTPIFNPIRWRSRWRLYEDFKKMCADAGALLYTIEVAFGERDFAITDVDNPRHIQCRTRSELWLKENAINVAVSRLPADWKYVAWVDADVLFARQDWANETLHQLQHYSIVQMWSHFQDLTPEHEVIGTARSFVECYLNGYQSAVVSGRQPPSYTGPNKPNRGYPGATGLAWAMRRDTWDHLGGLIDYSILGACDWYMAHALVGALGDVAKKDWTPAHLNKMLVWQQRAERYVMRNVGVVKGLALHYWHGPKSLRRYHTRDSILVKNNFDPDLDLKRDWQGLYQLTDRNSRLRDDLRWYFRQRNEDTI
jgi:hypothetical protein